MAKTDLCPERAILYIHHQGLEIRREAQIPDDLKSDPYYQEGLSNSVRACATLYEDHDFDFDCSCRLEDQGQITCPRVSSTAEAKIARSQTPRPGRMVWAPLELKRK